MWHIKLKGMVSRRGSSEILPRVKLVTSGWGSNHQISFDFFKSVGICDGAPSTECSSLTLSR